ncbi:mannosyl-oligosaccharide alpha-1,2-mannosidase IA-like [Bombyx mandarina]|uniref:alpha-1,2-Mannosidase n=1 Tax=Bombyx mandarina TaxID=7092 RepID=A0A6J2JHF6_BOMMA|nr:mannosyl-oligosaccharide alpha-1,2-mannosidase IA-like [Bombyx mandarina]
MLVYLQLMIYPIETVLELQDSELSVFETTIRFVGGLLSCYALTGDTIFRDKAAEVADALLPAFETPTGLPYALINPSTNVRRVFLIISHYYRS